jgi:single-stranded DNA-binding protein
MNNVQFTGRLVSDLIRSETANGTVVATGRLAVAEAGQGSGAGLFTVEAYGANAERALSTVSKGWLIALAGHIQHDQWQDSETRQRRQAYKVVGTIECLAGPNERHPSEIARARMATR